MELKIEVFKTIFENLEKAQETTKEIDLNVIHSIQRMEIYCVDYLALEKHDLDTFLEIAEHYFRVSFNIEQLNLIKQKFLLEPNNVSIENESYELASIFAQGIRFHKSILENPLFWASEI